MTNKTNLFNQTLIFWEQMTEIFWKRNRSLQQQGCQSYCILLIIDAICAKGMQDLSRLGLIQYYMLSYLQVIVVGSF